MKHPSLFAPPTPSDAYEMRRIDMQRRRRRMATGMWIADAEEEVMQQLGADRAAIVGYVDTSMNPALSVWQQLSVLYDIGAHPIHADAEAADRMAGILREIGYQSLMQRVQVLTLGCGEYVVEVLWSASPTGPILALATHPPDICEGESSRLHPGQPDVIAVWRYDGDAKAGQGAWVADRYDVTDPAAPRYDLLDDRREIAASLDYPLFDAAGQPVVPLIVYHARAATTLWDPWTGHEAVSGTLRVATMFTHFGHAMVQASWPQRYTVNARIPTDLTETYDDRQPQPRVVSDPTVVLQLQTVNEGDSVMVGQWASALDPSNTLHALSAYAAEVGQHAGLPASDATPKDGRSGRALAINRSDRREASAKYAPIFARSDAALLRAIAAAHNAAGGTPALPTSGWSMRYEQLPLSPEEETQRRDAIYAELDRGLISRAEAKARLDGITVAEAAARLDAIPSDAPLTPPTQENA